MNKFFRFAAVASISTLPMLTGCMGGNGYTGGGYGSSGGYSQPYGLGSVAGGAYGGDLTGAVLNAIIQSMASSVLNGQIGSQLAPADQNYRLQQFGQLLQSGAFNQPQQWTSPQTGNVIALNPLGQASIDPATNQNCRNLEETMTLDSGQQVREQRRACQDSRTGKWTLVQ